MSFIWPRLLVSLLLVPVLLVGYSWLLRRREEARAGLGTMGQLQTGDGATPGYRRHGAMAVFMVAITVLLVGLARPEATVDQVRKEGTVILAFDVSSSMRATDLKPSRMDAAKAAARRFVAAQPSSIKVGVVAFSDDGRIVQEPTTSKRDVLSAIGRLQPRGGTSLGHGIFASLDAVAGKPLAINPNTLKSGSKAKVPFLGSSSVIMLTDGEDTSRLDPHVFAQLASRAGVRIFPIGLGSANGAVVQIDGFNVATQLDASLLQSIARQSNGKYYRAQDASGLAKVYDTIDLQLTVKGEKTEVTGIVAGIGLLLLLVGAALSMRWYGRAP
ncbi:MAG: von Willebrand factor type [Actinomycetia bacterium]|nr:von Willebrand factor type [Actinomycetes bacterium]